MAREPTCLASALSLFVDALRELGVDADSILRACEIDPESLSDPEARVPESRFERVFELAAEKTGDRAIGLHAGERVHPRAVNVAGYLLLSSATLGEGLERVARYQSVVIGAPWFALREDAAYTHIEIGLARGGELRAIQAEYFALVALAFLNWVAERPVAPVEVSFRHPARAALADYARAFECPVKFGSQRSEVVLLRETLALPSAHAYPELSRLHDEFAARLLAAARLGTTVALARKALAALLESGEADVAVVARRLGLSARTLQRRLSAEGHSFRGVLDSLRRELAEHHLRHRRSSVTEAAYLTGFSEVSAFTRAARRWFGRTPRELRDGSSPRSE
jgi:AraC-like DNA-binding protein